MPTAVLEVGAGEEPEISKAEGDTLDIREDLDHIDYPGVDVGKDTWPVGDSSYTHIIMSNIIEHIPGYELSHLFSELDRVLVPGGTVEINLPHAGTYGAGTDPTHMGAGGTTADFAEYFGGNLENYWSEFNWDVESWAEVTFPVFFPSGLQIRKRINSGLFSMQMVKLPFVTGTVEVRVTKFAEE